MFIVVDLRAQQPSDNIDLNKVNVTYLERLIHEKINHFRKEQKLNKLTKDQHLYKAAQDQVKYINKNSRVEHTQPSKKKASPFKRVKYYGGLHGLVGENCHQVVLGVKTKVYGEKQRVVLKSYEDVANALVKGWINSKGHLQNIINENYYKVGTAIAVDKEAKFIYATQVFGSEPFVLPKGVKPIKNSYKLKPYDKNECDVLEKNYAYLPELLSNNIFFENGKIYFYFHDLPLFKEVLSAASDGLALDVVNREQFECGEGNRYYPSEIHTGILLKPIYKDQILSKNELKEKGELKVSFGPIPSFVDTNTSEFNLLVIKKKCLCQSIFYNSIDGENLRLLDLEFLIDTLSIAQEADTVIRTLEFEIPFGRNRSKYKLSDIKPFLDSLNLNKYDLKQIDLIAYSSVEGGFENNKRVQEKRAESIFNAIQKYQLKKVKTTVETQENWEGFFESIKGSPYELELKGMSKEQLRKLIDSDTLDYDLEPYLESQRQAKIKLIVEKIYKDDDLLNMIDDRYDYAIVSKDYNKAKVLQTVMFINALEGSYNPDSVINFEIPHLPKTVMLNNNKLAFKYYFTASTNKDSLYTEMLRDIETQLSIKPEPYLLYNKYMLNLLLWSTNLKRIKQPKEFLKDIKKLYPTKVQNYHVNRLVLNYYLIAADYYYDVKDFKEREKCLKEVKKSLLNAQLNLNQTYQIAKYFMFQMRIKWAINIMKPWINKNEFTEDFLFSFLTIAIYDKEQVPEKDLIRYLEMAKDLNNERFCKLFGFPNMSFQLFRDLTIKNIYCKSCNE